MAKQDNIKATFYGKLGALVGQRYKDQAILRPYVKPANPRTPAQQAHRALFGQASEIANYALSINYKAPCWEHSRMTEYAYRLKTAYWRLKNGSPYLKIIPLYPDGYTPQTQINDIVYTENADPTLSTISSAQIATLSVPRKIWLCVFYTAAGETEPRKLTGEAITTPGSGELIKGLPDYIKTATNRYVIGVSRDDVEHDKNMVYIHIKNF